MKKLLLLLVMLALCPFTAQANDFTDKMLELFKSQNQTVRLGAMLMLSNVADSQALVDYVRSGLDESDTVLERTVKLYFLARNANDLEHKDLLKFIEMFPENPQDFVDVLLFDSSISKASPSGVMLLGFDDWTSCRMPENVRSAARAKVERLRQTKLESGWAAEIFPETFPLCP